MPIKVIFLDVVGVLDIGGSRNGALINILEELKQKNNLQIVITTNSSLTQDNDPNGLTSMADMIISSTPENPKPSPEFWNDSFSKAFANSPGLQYNEVLVIDDRSDIIESARDFGFQTLHYQRGVSEEDLKEILAPDLELTKITLSNPYEVDQYFANL